MGVLLILTLTACAGPKVTLFPDSRDELQEFTLEGHGMDKVLVIPVNGTITHQSQTEFLRTTPSTVQEIVAHLKRAETDAQVKSVLLKIDSPGGSTTASDLLYHEISTFKKRTGKPVVAAMMNVAASGGYYIALAADAIVAHPTTITGSVGVIFMRPSMAGLTEKIGVGMTVSKSGINKDMGSPFREQTDAEKEIFQNITDELAQRFFDLVAKHRRVAPESLQEITTARIFTADQALKLGMIDAVGYLSDALTEAKKQADLPPDAKVIVYRRSEFKDDNIYNLATRQFHAPRNLVQLDFWPRIVPAESGFYYMWLPGVPLP
jgi:protease-4